MEKRKNLVAVGPESQADEAVQATESAEFVPADEPYVEAQEEWLEDEPDRRLGRFVRHPARLVDES